MKKKLRKISTILILIAIIGNVYSLTKIQNLEDELEKERNPSFEQAKNNFSAKIAFSGELFKVSSHSDWIYYEGYSQIDFWPTWEEAHEHSYKVCPNSGELSIAINKAVNDNLYMGLWDAKHPYSPMNAHFSLLGGNLMELNATLTESGVYIVGVNYRGVDLFSALKVTVEK